MPSVADFEVAPVLCTATVLVCYFLVLPNSCWWFLRYFTGTMAEDDDDPNQLWYICCQPAGEDNFMICCDCCHEWYHGECVGISVSQEDVMSRDNEKYVCPLCLQSSNDQFIQWVSHSESQKQEWAAEHGLIKPMPPRRTGSAYKSLSVGEHGGRPNNAGIKD